MMLDGSELSRTSMLITMAELRIQTLVAIHWQLRPELSFTPILQQRTILDQVGNILIELAGDLGLDPKDLQLDVVPVNPIDQRDHRLKVHIRV